MGVGEAYFAAFTTSNEDVAVCEYAEDLQAITAYLMDAPHSALRLQRLARIAAT
ncbi:hypothetical protein C4J96_1541 [Pseudomonas orientalis]|nr:hypothetical protein C4J96_1541 [Pseudomonas orientalis]